MNPAFLNNLQAKLASRGLSIPLQELRWLAAFPELENCQEVSHLVENRVRRRIAGEPVSRILGEAEFWSLPFALSPDTLEPRPDSETLVEAMLALHPDRNEALRILDLGTGTGCLLIAFLYERPLASGIGIDRSWGAIHKAAENARRNGVSERASFVQGDWAASLTGSFDLIVSNPPYIERAVLPTLSREVTAYDPLLALDGGEDGLEAYRSLLRDIPRLLKPGGHLVLEIGYDQGKSVPERVQKAGLTVKAVEPDLAGKDRSVIAVKC